METRRTPRVKTKYNDFSGGVQVYTSPLWVKDNETPYCQNVDISRPGTLRKSLGYTELGTSVETNWKLPSSWDEEALGNWDDPENIAVDDSRSSLNSSGTTLGVELSWDGGTSYTTRKNTGSITGDPLNFTLGSSSDTWGRTWTATELNNTNFRVYLSAVAPGFNNRMGSDFWNFTLNIPANCVISGIEVKMTKVSRSLTGDFKFIYIDGTLEIKIYYSFLDVPRGAFTFDKEDGTSEIYKLNNDSLQKYDTDWSAVTGTIASGTDHMEGVLMYINTGTGVGTGADSFVERMYFTVGLDDEVKFTNGSSIGEIANTYAKHIEAYKSRLYLGNVKQGTKTFPSRVIYSDISSDTFDNLSFIDDFGEPVTALKEYSGSLFFFSENKLASYDEYKLQTIPGNFGTTSSETVQNVQGRLVWYNRSGVYIYAGGASPQNIGKRVQDWIEAIIDPREVTAGIDDEERYNLYIGDVTVDGTAYSDVVLRYDISLNAWDILPDRPFKYWVRQRSGGVYKIYATDVISDRMWQVNNGRTLNGDEIVSEWVSAKLDMGQPDTYKNYYEAFVVFKPSGASEFMSLQYRLDGATGWNNIGNTLNNISVSGSDDIEGKRLVFPKNVQGKMIQFKLGHTSNEYGFNLYEINIKGDELRN
jgi:hypothetical protein